MDSLYKISLHLHMLSAVLLILSQGFYFWLRKKEDFVIFTKRLVILMLIQNVFIGMVVFTGLIMLAVTHFTVWNIEIVLMIFVITGVIVHQILINKKRKPIRSDEIALQQSYKSWVSKVYGAEIAAEIAVYIIALVLH
ncbi:hypothetical protein NitYY0826_C1791 [Nitratiruptor sp. YY08-26]|uniref:hypothetical protein n=1 Tax=unclassified Nitratiruptor TaxID=2624044 RepID=UPI001916161D|nr:MULTISPECIES: hypothetical protein [unclassified Nitratiruptor]BCD62903.1 hypothetical protein NitYY0813_C1789 [Nitratiruptor sp. YY08-13]BCD66838.1 hypothetical protein NitYY0826_C1791 [Nitratiruptor sp. YY08-26]